MTDDEYKLLVQEFEEAMTQWKAWMDDDDDGVYAPPSEDDRDLYQSTEETLLLHKERVDKL